MSQCTGMAHASDPAKKTETLLAPSLSESFLSLLTTPNMAHSVRTKPLPTSMAKAPRRRHPLLARTSACRCAPQKGDAVADVEMCWGRTEVLGVLNGETDLGGYLSLMAFSCNWRESARDCESEGALLRSCCLDRSAR